MADNTTITPGVGATVAADDVGGVLHQRVKVEFGANGTATEVSSAAPMPVLPAGAGDGASTLTNGRRVVPSAGTPVALTTTTACKWVTVIALPSNSQQVNVGGAGVLSALGTETGVPLDAGVAVTIPVGDLAAVFVNSRVNNEGVTYLAGA